MADRPFKSPKYSSNCFVVIHRVRPIQRAVACHYCCRKFNQGTYHDRFRLIKNKP